jgi:transketolase
MTSLSPQAIRLHVLSQSKRANVGHIGSALSVVEILSVLYGSILRIESPRDPRRERFVLSKGHAALALYSVFRLMGWISQAQLDTYCGNDTALGVHPERLLPGVDFCTGSLGMGLGFAAGAAWAARLEEADRRAFALLSDAECNEGAVWEAAMFAAHHRLANLTAVIDLNGQQAFGYTREVLVAENLAERWSAFGWEVHTVDGHDSAALRRVFAGLDYTQGKPHLLLARTTFGRGVSFMENQIKWHYWPMSEDEYQQAVAEVTAAGGGA